MATANIIGLTAGSTVEAICSDGTVLTVTDGVMTGDFQNVGQFAVVVIETLAGSANSPKVTVIQITVSAQVAGIQTDLTAGTTGQTAFT